MVRPRPGRDCRIAFWSVTYQVARSRVSRGGTTAGRSAHDVGGASVPRMVA